MSRYPDTPRPNTGYAFRSNRPTVIGGPEWAPQSRGLTRFNLAEADMSYRAKTWDQIAILYNFFEAVSGAAGRFTFVDFNGIGRIGGVDPGVPWRGLYVAKGDGASVGPWDLPTYGVKEKMTFSSGAGGVTAGANIVVTPASMTGISIGSTLTVVSTDGTHGEEVVVTAATATTFTATFALDKDIGFFINAPLVFENSVAKQTVVAPGLPGSEPYSIKIGFGTDGVDALYAFTAPAADVIVTISATCRRAMRRARFTASKNPFLFEVPAVYSAGPVNVAEVRK